VTFRQTSAVLCLRKRRNALRLLRPTGESCESSEPSRAAAQPSGAVAISAPDVAAPARGVRAIIDLIVNAAVVGTNEMAVVIAAMVLMPARQQRHRRPTVGELLDGRRVLPPGAPVSRRTSRRHRDEQRRHPNQRLHPAISIGGVVVPDSMAQLAENLKPHSGSAKKSGVAGTSPIGAKLRLCDAANSSPPPLWGGVGGGGGGRAAEAHQCPWHDPPPRPSPTRGEGVRGA
jgi:hypothetical protein